MNHSDLVGSWTFEEESKGGKEWKNPSLLRKKNQVFLVIFFCLASFSFVYFENVRQEVDGSINPSFFHLVLATCWI